MIKMNVIKKDVDGVKNQYVITSDEPITIEVTETESGHTIAHIYKGTAPDEYTEPVGAFDSDVEPTNWEVK